MLNACSDSEDNQNETELQSVEKSDSSHKCSGQNQPPLSYQNQVESECGVGLGLDVGLTEANPFTCQEPEDEGTPGADANIIKNTKEQGDYTKKDKIQPNLGSQAQSECQGGSQSQVEAMTKTTEMNKLWHCYLQTRC